MIDLKRWRWLDALFALMIAVQVAFLWSWRFFPSQDGPSHLYNASVLANYHSVPIYKAFYRIEFSLAGNMVSDLLLAALVKVFPVLIAEKVLISIYLVSFAVALRLLLTALAPATGLGLSFFAFVLSYNRFLHMGFWNFCLATSLVLLLLWVVTHPARPVRSTRTAAVALLSLATYAAHILAWVAGVAACCGILLWEQAGLKPIGKPYTLPERVRLLGAMLIPGVFAALFAVSGSNAFGFVRESLANKLHLVYDLPFLKGYSRTEWLFRGLVAGSMDMVLAIVLVRSRWLRRPFWNPFLAVAVMCSFVAVFGPDRYGDGVDLRARVAFISFLFLAAGVAASEFPPRLASALAVFLSAVSIFAMWNNRRAYQYWNERLTEYSSLEPRIAGNSAVLPLNLEALEINPVLHAVGYWAHKPFIDLWNYEAASDLFAVRFRPGKAIKPKVTPPLPVYLSALLSTGFPADYVLVDGGRRGFSQWDSASDASGLLPELQLVYSSPNSGPLRLYRFVGDRGSVARWNAVPHNR